MAQYEINYLDGDDKPAALVPQANVRSIRRATEAVDA
jgi:hypothetical protein